jgi:hypothetical protein
MAVLIIMKLCFKTWLDIKYIFATYVSKFLHCDIWQTTFWVGVLTSLDMCHNKTNISLFLSHSSSSKLHNLLLPSLHVTELGAVCYLNGLMHLLNFTAFEDFVLNISCHSFSHIYGTSGETELGGQLTVHVVHVKTRKVQKYKFLHNFELFFRNL